MKKIKLFFTGSAVLAAIVFAPFTITSNVGEVEALSIAPYSNQAPVITGLNAPTVLKKGEMGTWVVKAYDPENGSLGYAVDWGEVQSTYAMREKAQNLPFVQNSTFTHTYYNEGRYDITFTVSDELGARNVSTTTVLITNGNISHNQAPVITSLSGSDKFIAGKAGKVIVHAYDPENDSLSYSVDWGENNLFMNPLELFQSGDSKFVQNTTFSHVYRFPGIYTATFTVRDSAGLKDTASKQIKVVVNNEDDINIAKLKISNVLSEGGISIGYISWNTNKLANSKIYYSVSSPVDINSSKTMSIFDRSLDREHELTIYGLAPNTTFYFIVESTDTKGKTVRSGEYKFRTIPPDIYIQQ
jgi:PKD repeat protein